MSRDRLHDKLRSGDRNGASEHYGPPGQATNTENMFAAPPPARGGVWGAYGAGDGITQLYSGGATVQPAATAQPQPPQPAQPAAPGNTPPAAATRESFEVTNWSARSNSRGGSGRGTAGRIVVQSNGIHAAANVRALTPEAQRFNVGFVQTMRGSTRRALYADGDGNIVNTWLVTRGTVMDQRTDIRSPAPWYNYGVSLTSGSAHPGMSDNPTVAMPQYSPEHGLLTRLEGTEMFTTYLVVMVGNDSSTIIYLGNVHWSINWNGNFNAGMVHANGGHANLGGASLGDEGGAVLSGPPANAGPDGSFVGAPAAASGTSGQP